MTEAHLIDSYQQRNFWSVNLHYELYPTRLRIVGKCKGEQIDMNFRLEHLDAIPDKRWGVNPEQTYASWLLMFSMGAMLFSYFLLPDVQGAFGICTLLFIISTIYFFIIRSRIEYSYYKYSILDRVEYAFGFGKEGPQSSHFDEFVETLNSQIKTVRATNLFETTDPGSPE